MQAQREAHTAEKLLHRLPVLEALSSEQHTAAAALETAEANAIRVREAVAEQKAAAETALAQAANEPQRTKAEQAWQSARRAEASALAHADAALEQARISADYEYDDNRRRYALAELGQLRRRLAEKATQRTDQEKNVDAVRQAALGDLSKLRELEAERIAVDTRLGFLQSKSAWLQKQVAQGYPDHELWENAQRRNAETAALQRLDVLLASQRRHIAHLAGAAWEPLYRYLSGATP